jgi:hypothetical protein
MNRIISYILLALFILIMGLMLTGCCPKIVPVSNNTTITTDTVYKTIVRDSIVKLPGKEITINAGVKCDSLNRAQMQAQTFRKDGMTETAEIKNGVLTITCREDSLKLLLKIKDRFINIQKKIISQIVNNVLVHKTAGFDIFLRWLFLFQVVAIALWFFSSGYFKPPKIL